MTGCAYAQPRCERRQLAGNLAWANDLLVYCTLNERLTIQLPNTVDHIDCCLLTLPVLLKKRFELIYLACQCVFLAAVAGRPRSLLFRPVATGYTPQKGGAAQASPRSKIHYFRPQKINSNRF